VAKKARTPAPPRPVQAPQRRNTKGKPKQGSTDERNKWLLIAFAASGVIGLAIVAAVVVLASGSSNANAAGIPQAMRAAGCTYTTAKSTSHNHVTSLSAKIKYNTTPPTNGNHYYQPAQWGFYTTPANPIQVVHNQEHGGIILWWGNKVPQSTITKLHSFYDESPNAMFGTPYAALGNKIAITAWPSPAGGNGTGVVATCSAFNKSAFTKFRDAFRGKGRERFPVSILTPGT
jgi:hypothetical protein